MLVTGKALNYQIKAWKINPHPCQLSKRGQSKHIVNSQWNIFFILSSTFNTHIASHFTVRKIKSAVTQKTNSFVHIWPISWNWYEVISTVAERQASTLHTKQSAMHSNKLINSQLSSPLFSPTANATACLAARSCSLKAQDEICAKPWKWTKMRSKRNAITCAWAIPAEFICHHQRKYFYKWQRGQIAWFTLTQHENHLKSKSKQSQKRQHNIGSATSQQWTLLPKYGSQSQTS